MEEVYIVFVVNRGSGKDTLGVKSIFGVYKHKTVAKKWVAQINNTEAKYGGEAWYESHTVLNG